jgi:hypothetical protein
MFPKFLPEQASNLNPPNLSLQVARITSMSHTPGFTEGKLISEYFVCSKEYFKRLAWNFKHKSLKLSQFKR